jgi:hypothetical protein
MHRAALLNYAILSLPTTGHATKREFCIAGHLASMLRGIVLAGKEKKYFRSCGTNKVMGHLYRVLTSCKNSCLYEHAVYQAALACLWFFCKNEVLTKALLMAADSDAVGHVRWMLCLSSVVRTGVTLRNGCVKWTVCLSDALLLMNFMLSVADSEEMMRFVKVINDENVLPLAFSALLVENDAVEQHRHAEHEAICRMAALFIQILALYCFGDAHYRPASAMCEALIIDQKMFNFVGRWLCACELQQLEPATIVSCLVLLAVSFLLGPFVDDLHKDVVLMKVSLIAERNMTSTMVGRYANMLKEMLSEDNASSQDTDEATIQALLPSPLELLVFFLGSDVDEGVCCSWCGRCHEGLAFCSQCRISKYCGSACQVSHWDRHKLGCKSDVS